MRSNRFRTGVIAVAAALSLALTACGSDDTAEPEDTATEEMSESMAPTEDMTDDMTESMAPTEDMTESMAPSEDMTEPMMMEPVGDACSEIPADGEGSSAGMADDPVANAAASNPLLSTLVGAVGAADLVDTLNSSEALTVFAPVNTAFEDIPSDTLDAVMADQDALTGILTLHVAEGQMDVDALAAAGTVTTLAGGDLEFDGEAMTVTSPGGTTANVVCGNVQTANATVHLIDAVLMPAG